MQLLMIMLAIVSSPAKKLGYSQQQQRLEAVRLTLIIFRPTDSRPKTFSSRKEDGGGSDQGLRTPTPTTDSIYGLDSQTISPSFGSADPYSHHARRKPSVALDFVSEIDPGLSDSVSLYELTTFTPNNKEETRKKPDNEVREIDSFIVPIEGSSGRIEEVASTSGPYQESREEDSLGFPAFPAPGISKDRYDVSGVLLESDGQGGHRRETWRPSPSLVSAWSAGIPEASRKNLSVTPPETTSHTYSETLSSSPSYSVLAGSPKQTVPSSSSSSLLSTAAFLKSGELSAFDTPQTDAPLPKVADHGASSTYGSEHTEVERKPLISTNNNDLEVAPASPNALFFTQNYSSHEVKVDASSPSSSSESSSLTGHNPLATLLTSSSTPDPDYYHYSTDARDTTSPPPLPSSSPLSTIMTDETNSLNETANVQIQPNRLYATWKNPALSASASSASQPEEENKDRVEEILDGIIHALDKRLNEELPSEPRVKTQKTKVTDESDGGSAAGFPPLKQPAFRRDPDDGEDDNSFKLPPIPTGYIMNLDSPSDQPTSSGHSSKADKSSASGPGIIMSSNSNPHLYHHNGQGTPPHSSHSSPSLSQLYSNHNSVGKIQVSSMIGFSAADTRLPRPPHHSSSGSASFLVLGDGQDEYRKGSVLDEAAFSSGSASSHSSGVEIITAKTPFYADLANLSNSDSILVNLSPATLKVGSSSPPAASPPSPSIQSGSPAFYAPRF